jgi:hypothetical protein
MNSGSNIGRRKKMNNYWGEPDEEPLPDWMNPKTYQNGGQPKKRGKSLEQIAEEVLKKPAVHIILREPNIE